MLAKSLGDMVSLGTVSLEKLTETRILLMAPVIDLACKNADEKDFAAIERTIEDTERSQALHERLEYSRRFHAAIAHASHNPLLEILADATNGVVFEFIEQLGLPVMPDVARGRRRLLQFLQDRDSAKAVKEMKLQLEELHRYLLTNMPAPRA